MAKQTRPIYVITAEIVEDMKREYLAALQSGKKNVKHWRQKYIYFVDGYLNAMLSLDKVTDNYGCDSGRSIVNYALCNLNTWKGEKAREIKAELKELAKY